MEGTASMNKLKVEGTSFVAILLLLSSIVVWSQSPVPTITPIDVSKIDFSKISEEDIKKTEEHRKQLEGEVSQHIGNVVAISSEQGATLSEVKAANEATRKSFEQYRGETEAMIIKGNQAIASLAHVVKKLHTAKWILTGLWLAFCALVVLKLPSPIGFYVGAALVAGGEVFIWLWV